MFRRFNYLQDIPTKTKTRHLASLMHFVRVLSGSDFTGLKNPAYRLSLATLALATVSGFDDAMSKSGRIAEAVYKVRDAGLEHTPVNVPNRSVFAAMGIVERSFARRRLGEMRYGLAHTPLASICSGT
jgi:hypothetical protein